MEYSDRIWGGSNGLGRGRSHGSGAKLSSLFQIGIVNIINILIKLTNEDNFIHVWMH